MIEAAVCQRVREGARLHELLADAEGALRQQQVVLPGLTVLDRLIGAARLTAEEEIFAEIVSWASLLTQQQTLILLRGDTPSTDAARLPPLQRLKQASGRASPEAFARELQNLARVREVLPDDFNLFDFNLHLINRFAEIVAGASTRTLQQFSEIKRIALVLCWLWRARSQMIDTSLVIGNELIAGVFRRARHAFERAQKKQQKRAGKVLKSCGEVMRLLLDASIPDEQLRAALFDRYSREKLDDLSTECRALAHPPDIVYLKELARSYSYVRKFSPKLLDAFALHAATEQLPLRAAIAYLREHKGVRTLDAAAPLEFVPAAWRPHVNPAPGVIDRPFYEMCLLDRLRQSLKSGAVHVPHSHAFQSLNAYLLSDEQWETKRAQLTVEYTLPLNFAEHWAQLEMLLKKQLRLLDNDYPENAKLKITGDRFHVARLEKLGEPETVRHLKRELRRRMPVRQLPDVLLEVEGWTGFLRGFTRLATGRPVTEADAGEQLKLLACLIAEGCNIGLSDMAVVGPGFSYDELEEVHSSYIREETLAAAATTLVNYHLRQSLVESWGYGATSSSDAQLYGVPVRALNASFHPRYFASAGRGIGVYTHLSDTWMPFYTQVIACHARQAPFILDGLLYHGTQLEPKEHYTDTHGYTEIIFAVCHLLGIRFAPRIKDLPEQRLWKLPVIEEFKHIEAVFSGQINKGLIEEQWDEMLRLMASIKSGTVRASFVIAKLSAAGRTSKLFRAMQETGRLIKTAYIAEYLRDEELRRRVLLGLNKIESLHAFSRKLFFGGRGEMRDRTYEDQLNAASSLNLLLAAIIVWNTVQIQTYIEQMRAAGLDVNASDLRYLSPLMRQHLGIYGRYLFDVERYGAQMLPPVVRK